VSKKPTLLNNKDFNRRMRRGLVNVSADFLEAQQAPICRPVTFWTTRLSDNRTLPAPRATVSGQGFQTNSVLLLSHFLGELRDALSI
jgi:hypothetical protein